MANDAAEPVEISKKLWGSKTGAWVFQQSGRVTKHQSVTKCSFASRRLLLENFDEFVEFFRRKRNR